MKIYTVQEGDSLYEIAKKHGVDLSELEKANPQLSDPNKIMPGMKIKVPTGGVHVKKKEMPVKKEAPIKKEVPIKKEMPVKKEVPEKKEVPIPAEKPINMEISINKETVIEEVPVKEKPVAEKKQMPEKPVKKILPKMEKKPIFKEKEPEKVKEKEMAEEEKVKFKHTNVLPPTLPLNEEPFAKEEPLGTGKYDIPMMDEPFPNMITPKKDPVGEMPTWQYPFETYGGMSAPSSYYPGMPQQGVMTGTYSPSWAQQGVDTGTYYSGMPQQGMDPGATTGSGYMMPAATSYSMPMMSYPSSPCGCDGFGSSLYYSPSYPYSGQYQPYGEGAGYPTSPMTTSSYTYGAGTYYPQPTYGPGALPDGETLPAYYSQGMAGYSQQTMADQAYTQQAMAGYPEIQPGPYYPQSGSTLYPGTGYRTSDYGNQPAKPYQPEFPKWGDDEEA
ncbi:MAG: SafA/ExsA family spore coat assembly protein [Tuberibacillus sp.]